MTAYYDFSNARTNPYSNRLKKQITIHIDSDTIVYSQAQSQDSCTPYQTLINLYLSDCVKNKRKLNLSWN